MNILFVAPGLPNDRNRIRLRQIAGVFAARGDRVVVLAPSHLVDVRDVSEPSVRSWEEAAPGHVSHAVVVSKGYAATLRAARALLIQESLREAFAVSKPLAQAVGGWSKQADLVILKRKRMGRLSAAVASTTPVILDLTDSVALWQLRVAASGATWKERVLNTLDLPGTCRLEVQLSRSSAFCQIWLASELDAEFLAVAAAVPKNRFNIVPNAVEGRWLGEPLTRGERSVAFHADFRQPTNQDAGRYLVQEVWPSVRSQIAGVVLDLYGHGSEAYSDDLKSVRGHGFVDDIVHAVNQARVVVAPLRAGAGTKNKVLQALALGKPVVGTRIAFEGLGAEVRHLPDVLVPEEGVGNNFAESLICLLSTEVADHQVAASRRRQFIAEGYSFDALREQVESAIAQVR